MESTVIIWPGGLVGHRIMIPEGEEKPVSVEGVALAMRHDGDEVLFAAIPEDPETKVPAAWIPITSFVVNPVTLATEEDFFEEEEEPLPDGIEPQPEERHPMESRRPGMKVLRRDEK